MDLTFSNTTNSNRKKNIFRIVLIFLMTTIFFFKFEISYNEMDVIPFAKATFNPDWIKNDWYLNNHIPYRFMFSYIIGFFIHFFGIIPGIIIGRLLSYLFIAYALNQLINLIKVKTSYLYFLMLISLFFFFFPTGMGAGEWMVGGLETKVFSYGFVMLSIAALLNEKHRNVFLFAGLALSLHTLIGLFHLFCLIPVYFLLIKDREALQKDFFKVSGLFIISGAVGFYAIYYSLFQLNSDPHDFWSTYVNIRVPHHLIPSKFPIKTWYLFTGMVLTNVFILIQTKAPKTKIISTYALSTASIFTIGLLVFLTLGNTSLLRFYFFRMADIILPLLTLFTITNYLLESKQVFLKTIQPITKFIVPALIVFLCSFPIRSILDNYTFNTDEFSHNATPKLNRWIRTQTNKNSVFIVPPHFKYFYLNAERAMLVSWKHSPQDAKNIKEWYHRLKLLNRNEDFNSLQEVFYAYRKLETEDVLKIKEAYPNVSYFLSENENLTGLKKLFSQEGYTIYAL